MASPSWKWRVKFSKTSDPGPSDPEVFMGELHLWILKDWITLVSESGVPIIGKFLTDNELVTIGSVIYFSSYQAKVVSCILSPDLDLNGSESWDPRLSYDSCMYPHLIKS
jgi:hypothetical protein